MAKRTTDIDMSDPNFISDANIIAWFVDLIGSRRKNEFRRAADALDQLADRGVIVKFKRRKPATTNRPAGAEESPI